MKTAAEFKGGCCGWKCAAWGDRRLALLSAFVYFVF